MYRRKIYKKYEALGFVEALMAILVAGITSIVLMSVAIDTIKQVVKNELSDNMTQVAIEGASMVKTIGELNSTSEEVLFPRIDGNVSNCYALEGTVSNPAFNAEGETIIPVCNYDSGDRNSCKDATTSYEDLFRVFCITAESDGTSGLVVGKVIVGKNNCSASADCDISDYSYYVLTKTAQK